MRDELAQKYYRKDYDSLCDKRKKTIMRAVELQEKKQARLDGRR